MAAGTIQPILPVKKSDLLEPAWPIVRLERFVVVATTGVLIMVVVFGGGGVGHG